NAKLKTLMWTCGRRSRCHGQGKFERQIAPQFFGPGLHVGQPEALDARRLRISDTGAVLGDLENEVRGIATHAHVDDRRLGMPPGVAHRFLRDSEEIFLGRWRQALFGYTGGMKITAQSPWDI